jgi:speckle-type POZ protein
MFDDSHFVDFVLRTSDNKELKTHKSIIVARSPVFFAMLKNDTKEAKENSADVPDFDSKTMKEFLRYIYSNEVQDLESIARDLVFAAEKYEIDGLKKICMESLHASISTENVVQTLKIADRVSESENLFNKCLDVIVK